LSGDLCEWLVNSFDPYSVILYISAEKKIENTPALSIGGMKIEEFYGKKTKDAKYNKVFSAWIKEWSLQDGNPKLSQMPHYILSQADAGESFKRNFVLYMVSCFFNGLKNVDCAQYFAKNVANVEDIATIYWCQYTIDRLCESVKERTSNFDGPILFLMVSSFYYIKILCFQ